MLLSCSNNDNGGGQTMGFYGGSGETKKVYICTGRNSHAYHKTRDCYGLSNCSRSILKVSLEEAEEEGRTPCHYCH